MDDIPRISVQLSFSIKIRKIPRTLNLDIPFSFLTPFLPFVIYAFSLPAPFLPLHFVSQEGQKEPSPYFTLTHFFSNSFPPSSLLLFPPLFPQFIPSIPLLFLTLVHFAHSLASRCSPFSTLTSISQRSHVPSQRLVNSDIVSTINRFDVLRQR